MSATESFFKLKEKGTDVKTEFWAGITTFATMAYILAVNPNILGASGMDTGAVFVATALAAIIGTVLMGLLANLPFALAPGMGLNAFFAFSVVIGMGHSPQFALACVLTEGLVFCLLSLSGIRTKIFNAIPLTLKHAVGAGIGLFIVFIGFKNAGVVVGDPATFVAMGDVKQAAPALALIGIAITIFLLIKKVKAALLIGIVITWVLGIIAQVSGWYIIDFEAGLFPLIPESLVSLPPSLAPTLGICFSGFQEAFSSGENIMAFLTVTFAFFFVDVFDTLGTLSGVASKAKMLDKYGKLEKSDQALLADAVATSVGAVLGTSTTTTYIESAAGVQEGGRTGLTAMVTAAFFALSLLFSPIFLTIPAFATATALVVVGLLMMEPIMHLKLDNLEELLPLGVTVITMPLFYSISHGLIFGFLTYVIVKISAGKFKEISPLMWFISLLFLVQIIFFG